MKDLSMRRFFPKGKRGRNLLEEVLSFLHTKDRMPQKAEPPSTSAVGLPKEKIGIVECL